ncbi:AtzH-like domain-containing protein [Nocardioides terrae]|nr:AtzH-like domain-containing protein [Nocardioides terrae]
MTDVSQPPRNLQPPPGLVEAFRAYEAALMADDRATLDRLFAPGETTLRGDAAGLLVGHDAIGAAASGGEQSTAQQRRLVQTHVQTIDDDHALVVAVTEPATGGRGQQTQLWARVAHEWRITAAHISVPAPALDRSVWRIVGDPLVPSTDPDGTLSGETVAVKDLYAVAGQRIGAGTPEWLQHAAPEAEHADAVRLLLDAGAEIRGIARTVELAYGLTGANAHYGTPPNPRAPHRLPGGSSSGSASAVSLGHASIGLGTDTAGSIRVPAAYQGLFGIRTTTGAVPTGGVLPLAPGYDAVGWLTRSAFLLRAVGDVLLPDQATGGDETLVVVPELLGLAAPDVAEAIRAWIPEGAREEHWPLHRLDDWVTALATDQGARAWQVHGEWLAPRMDTLGADVRQRFENASRITPEQAEAARTTAADAGRMVRDLVGDRIVVLPSAPTVAPHPGEHVRGTTRRLTSLATLGGLPAVSLPLRTARGLPTAVCLVAAPGRDRDLLDLATRLSEVNA